MKRKIDKDTRYRIVISILAFLLMFFAHEIRAIARHLLLENWEKASVNNIKP